MKRRTNAIRMTKEGVKRMDALLSNPFVDNFHKTLLKGIKSNMPKNVSKADTDVFKTISDSYKHRGL